MVHNLIEREVDYATMSRALVKAAKNGHADIVERTLNLLQNPSQAHMKLPPCGDLDIHHINKLVVLFGYIASNSEVELLLLPTRTTLIS